MNSLEKNTKLTLEFLKGIAYDQNYAMVEELLAPNSLNYTDFGLAIGIEGMKSDIYNWFSVFSKASIEITDQIVTEESVVYRFMETVDHIAPFKSIAATGKRITFDALVIFRTAADGQRITSTHFSANSEQIIRQLIDDQQADIAELLHQPIINGKDDSSLQKILNHLKDQGIKLTTQQLRCLSLWFSGRTTSEIAILLSISHRTVEAHLGIIKDKLRCRRKKEIFELLEQQNLLHIMQACSNVLLSHR